MIYLALPSTEISCLRVAERVAHGGHNIPEDDIIRRFPRSLHNLFQLFAEGTTMSVQISHNISPETQAMLDCLQQAVTNALERKRRLGQYAVFWSGDAAFAVGEDAPVHLKAARETSED